MRKFLVILLFPVIAGCTLLGETVAETPEERLVVLEYSYQAALKTIDRLVDTGIVYGDSAIKIVGFVKVASGSMKSARSAVALGSSDATSYIIVANSVVFQLIEYLSAQERE